MLQLYTNIKQRRKELHYTQSELAEKLGYADKSMIAKIEKGIVDLPQSKILEFAKALNVSPSDLMGWDLEEINRTEELAKEGFKEFLKEVEIKDALQQALNKDTDIGDYKYSDEEIDDILKYARYIKEK